MNRILFGTLILVVLTGCSGGSPEGGGDLGGARSEGQRLFGGGNGGGDPQDADEWSIGLMVFMGPERQSAAEDAAADLRSRDRLLRAAFVVDRGERALVMVGRHPSPRTAEAVEALERVRRIRLDGERPFEEAFFVPPPSGEAGDLDLRSARERFGALYSLQIGVYGKPGGATPSERELAEIRATAEDAARRLRREGELAFYFHGPSLSMVTVGALRQDDIEGQTPAVALLRERFPHNLLNGQGVRQRVQTQSGPQWQMQPSFAVAIPE
ncbi:MAG: membrane lipoprotein lipid attachment site-containing protein [Planctomycetota bacterium]